MTRPLLLVPLLSLLAWTVAWYAPEFLLVIGGGLLLSAVYDVCVEE